MNITDADQESTGCLGVEPQVLPCAWDRIGKGDHLFAKLPVFICTGRDESHSGESLGFRNDRDLAGNNRGAATRSGQPPAVDHIFDDLSGHRLAGICPHAPSGFQILNRVQEGVDKPRPKVLFEPGEVVRVIDGPFNDFSGVVEQVNYEKSRLQVAVQILGRSTPVELDFGQVEKG